MPLSPEDRWVEIGRHLDLVGAGAEMAERHATMLAARPDFETLAEIDLNRCAAALRLALARIERAQAIYRDKEIEQ
jgi:hypothetical protein